MTKLCLEGDFKKARELQLKYLRMMNGLFMQVNPIPVKTALGYLGVCSDRMRMPLVEMDDCNKERLIRALNEVRN